MRETISGAGQPEGRPGLRRKTPQQRRSRLTVESILQATREVIEKDGVANLTTTRIAERAGISVGAFYEYYPNRESVLLDLHEQVSAGIGDLAAALARHDGAGSPSDSVRLAVTHLYGAHESYRPLLLDVVGTVPALQRHAQCCRMASKRRGEQGWRCRCGYRGNR